MRHIFGKQAQRHSRAHGAVVYGPYPPPQRPTRHRVAHTGTEPVTARTDLPLRRLLSLIFGSLFLIGAAAFAILASQASPGPAPNRDTFVFFAALCAAFVLIAGADLVVVTKRLAAGRRMPPQRGRS